MDRFIKFLFWGLFLLLSPWAIQAQNETTIYPAITQEYTELQFDSALVSARNSTKTHHYLFNNAQFIIHNA